MFDYLKESLAFFILKRRIKKSATSEPKNFSSFFSKTENCFIIMPGNSEDFSGAMEVVDFIKAANKTITILLREEEYSSLPEKEKYLPVFYNEEDRTKIGLPNKSFLMKFSSLHNDLLLDLNRLNDIFFSATAAAVQADYKIGFKKRNSDNIYNFQVANKANNPNISYEKLLNSIKMF